MNFLVDVNIACYNHGQFIEQAIESVLDQKTNFSFRILIGDDASNDNSSEVIKKLETRYSNKIKAYYHPFNRGINTSNESNGLFLLKQSKSKYIALLDGDDYWTNSHKLQNQVNFLESNPEYTGCFHDSTLIDTYGKTIKEVYFSPTQKEYDQKACLTKLGSSYATSSLMFCRHILSTPLPLWYQKAVCDEFLDLLITEKGKLGYLSGPSMSVYRIHDKGIWQGESSLSHHRELFTRAKILYEDDLMRQRYGKWMKKRMRWEARNIAATQDANYLERSKYLIKYLRLSNYTDRHNINQLLLLLLRMSIGNKRYNNFKNWVTSK